MSQSKGVRTILTALMDALVVVAVLLTAALVVAFFGTLREMAVGAWLLSLAKTLTLPFGLPKWATPYNGSFSADMGVSVAAYLVAEWLLSVLRRK